MLDSFNNFIKYIFIFSTILYVFDYIYNNTKNKKSNFINWLIINVFSIILSLLYSILIQHLSLLTTLIILCILLSFINVYRTNIRFSHSFILILLSSSITISLYVLCALITILIVKLPMLELSSDNPMILLIAIVLESLFLYKFFKLKRFKDGITFLKDSNIIDVVGILSIIFGGLSFIIYSLLGNYVEKVNEYLVLGILLILIGLISWIRKQLNLYYKDMQKNKAIFELEKELKEQKDINTNVTNDLEKISKINHRYSARISALDRWAKDLDNSEVLTDLKSTIYNLNEEYSSEITNEFNLNNNFTKTTNSSLDNLLDYFKKELVKNNIKLSFNFNINKYEELNKLISNSDLEILISNLINNSNTAIKYGNSKNNKILLELSCNNGIYEISVSDTGIPFEVDTLSKLGNERISTHKETGGTGFGFITIFEILRKYNGSFIINELSNDNIFTKILTIRLDNKFQYIINSYRYNELKNSINHNIILNNI